MQKSKSYAIKFIPAFTLAEVLITIGIIGVVAAMTLPTLIQNYQEKALVNKLKVAYSIFSQAHLQAINDNGPAEHWDIGNADSSNGAQKLFDIYKPYLKIAKECGTGNGCYYSGTYKALFNNIWGVQLYSYNKYAKGKLTNGMAFHFYSNGSGCPNKACATIGVDINGDKEPNQAGVDYFYFTIRPDKVVPFSNISSVGAHNNRCKYNDTSNKNGAACTAWVISRENMDYRRRDISAEWVEIEE